MSRPSISHNTFSRPQVDIAISQTDGNIGVPEGRDRSTYHSSNTWTSSSGDINLRSDGEEVGVQVRFIEEYNRLAKKYGVRPIIPGDFPGLPENTFQSLPSRRASWIARVLRHTSSGQQPQPSTAKFNNPLRHRRSISDLALNFVHTQRSEGLKDEDLRGLVRLCGKSTFYLPADYAPSSLVLPTCLRAIAQYLVQHADTHGIFRVPGSMRVVNALYDYYCAEQNGEEIASTTRCPNLPAHLNCGVHDVASTFKRLLAGLPGGILGSLTLFDALVAIHSQLHGNPENAKTKESTLRARLIALAIATVKSQYQRELICAVFGLLCLIGRVAENARREDETGRPLPTSDLMGYNSLAIVFGPLLVGDLINSYSMKVADPASGLILFPLTPPKRKKHRNPKTSKQAPTMMTVDRILVANDITEMMVVHWRDVVRHLKNLGALRPKRDAMASEQRTKRGELRLSASDSFSLGRPPGWCAAGPSSWLEKKASSPLAVSPTPSPRLSKSCSGVETQSNSLSVKRRRPRQSGSASSYRISRGHPANALSPTVEESLAEDSIDNPWYDLQGISSTSVSYQPSKEDILELIAPTDDVQQLEPTSRTGQPSALKPAALKSRRQSVPLESSSRQSTNPARRSVPQERNVNPAVLAGDILQDTLKATTPPATMSRHARSIAQSEQDLHDVNYVSSVEKSTAGHSPLHHGQQPIILGSTIEPCVTRTENDMQPPGSKWQNQDSGGLASLYLHDNVMLPHNRSPLGPVLSEGEYMSSTSEVVRFPSFHQSAIGSSPNQTYAPTVQMQATSQETGLSGGNSVTEKSSASSLRQFIAKNSSGSPLGEKLSSQNDWEEHPNDLLTRKTSPGTKWRKLIGNSPTTSSAQLREKRLIRNTAQGSPRKTEESGLNEDQRATNPELELQISSVRNEEKNRPQALSPEKKGIFEQSPQQATFRPQISPIKGQALSPAKALTETGTRPLSPRSTSKPVSGAVKAMAALFDNASKDSSNERKLTLTGRSRSDLRNSHSFLPQNTIKTESPAKSIMSTVTPAATTPQCTHESKRAEIVLGLADTSGRAAQTSITPVAHGVKAVSGRTIPEDTPTKLPKVSLRHVAARNEPPISPSKVSQQERESSHPLSLRTMVPHCEESPVAQHMAFVRPSSAASSRSYVIQQHSTDNIPCLNRGSPVSSLSRSPILGTGNGLLHTEIRTLQKQLALRNEEILQLRQQVEARSNMDVGTLSEQLRLAKRKCKMWRERAEAAEQSVAIFERFTTKVKGLKECPAEVGGTSRQEAGPSSAGRMHRRGGTLDGSSGFTSHTENQDTLRDRVRNSIKMNAEAGNNDAVHPETDDGKAECHSLNNERITSWRDISRRTAQLWVAAEQLLSAQGSTDG
ncbi:hypothetical protein BJ170DRAFT_735969 [Xylariales sp. AK1849]|nr:hypothetical protein BJ170DRAFT_735969 [Xylariales sp. AK1849]